MFPFFGFPRRAAANLGIRMTGAIVLPLFAVSGQAQVGRDMVGTVNLAPITVSGSATVGAQPSIQITTPANADTHTFEGNNNDTEAMTVSGTASAGSSGSISSVTYSVTGATTQSGTATGTTTWTFNITALAFGNSTVTVTVTHSNGNTSTDAITLKRTPCIGMVSNYNKTTTPKAMSTAGYVRGHGSTIVSYVFAKDGETLSSGYCTTGTPTITKSWGGSLTVGANQLAWTAPLCSIGSGSGSWTITVSCTNDAGTTTNLAYTVNVL